MITGQVEALSNASVESAGEAVTLAMTMLGIMAMWTGLMEVAREAGIMDRMTKGLRPVIKFFFTDIPSNHRANEYIAANFVANILGLGWAATPMGLKAMKEMADIYRERVAGEVEKVKQDRRLSTIEKERRIEKLTKKLTKASDDMCTFLVINISSLQVIPVSVIAYRSQYGSVNPVAIVIPGLIATIISTVTGVVFCKMMSKRR